MFGIDFTRADIMAKEITEPAINKYPLVEDIIFAFEYYRAKIS